MIGLLKGFRYRVFLFAVLISAAVPLAASFAQQAPVPVHFVYRPSDPAVVSVSLRGDFNNWGETPMQKQPDGSFAVTVLLTPGRHQYKFFINGKWPKDMSTGRDGGPVDPSADGYVGDGYGGKNAFRNVSAESIASVSLGDGKIYTVGLSFDASNPADVIAAASGTVVRLRTAPADVEQVQAQWRANERSPWTTVAMTHVGTTLNGWMYAADIPTESSFNIRFLLNDGAGTLYYGTSSTAAGAATSADAGGVKPFPVLLPLNGPPLIRWTQGVIAYQIFPDRFRDGNPMNNPPGTTPWRGPLSHDTSTQYYGGDLRGIIDELPYLHRLGVGMIYLNPIFQAGSSHRYDTIDYMKIDPSLGTLSDFQELIAKAHALGIRIILDGVFNHTGTKFWAFQDVVKNGASSRYAHWYFFKSFPVDINAGNYESWSGVASLPKLNIANPEVENYIFSVVKYWTRQGIDGWRLDAANEITVPGFWSKFRNTVKSINPNCYLLGEIWQVAPEWLKGNRFDSLMNYPIGYYALLPFFDQEKGWTVSKTAAAIESDLYAYPPSVEQMGFNVLDSHDTALALTILGGGDVNATPDELSIKRMEAAVGVQFTMPGMPVIYYGDERGMTGDKRDYWDGQRAPVDWAMVRVPELFDYYKAVAAIRRDHAALWTASLKDLLIDNADSVWAYQRSDRNESIVVVTTNKAGAVSAAIPGIVSGTRYRDLVTGDELAAGPDGLTVKLDGPATRILIRR